MIYNNMRAVAIAGALLSCVGWNGASAQAPGDTTSFVGRVYTLHTMWTGDCPSLDWHIVVGEGNTLAGLISTDNNKAVFRVAGAFNPQAKTFQLAGTEIGSGRPGAVNGKIQPDGRLEASLGGLPLGAACQGKSVSVQWVTAGNAAGGD